MPRQPATATVVWLSFGLDGVGHAFAKPSSAYVTRAACGEVRREPRYEWPVKSRCERCVAARGEAL